MKEHFEVGSFMNNKDLSYNNNVVSRFRNNFVGAITNQKVFPKIVVIVPDNDIIKYFWYKNEEDVLAGYTRIIKWLMCQYDRMVATQKEFLPIKCKNNFQPQFVWIQPPLHDYIRMKENMLRKLFSKALNSVASLHNHTTCCELKKVWDPQDRSLYNRDERCFTSDGLIAYWQAVDKTVKYFDTLLLKKKLKKLNGNMQPNKDSARNDQFERYHWDKSSHQH